MSQYSLMSMTNVVNPPSITLYRKTSGVFVAPMDGVVDMLVIGGHGGGATARGVARVGVTGAGAGGTGMKFNLVMRKGESLTYTVGAGGSSTAAASGSMQNGGDGGATSVIHKKADNTVIESFMVTGGQGGRTKQFGSTVATDSLAGGVGGTAAGSFDVKLQGGNGGSININSGTAAAFIGTFATGSGAINLGINYNLADGSPTRGGNIQITTVGANTCYASTGGGGVGGTGGDVVVAAGANNISMTTGGGGYGGNGVASILASAPDYTAGGADANDSSTATETPRMFTAGFSPWFLDIFGHGGTAHASTTPANALNGGGGAGTRSTNAVNTPGIFWAPGAAVGIGATAAASVNMIGLNGPGGANVTVGGTVPVPTSVGDSVWLLLFSVEIDK